MHSSRRVLTVAAAAALMVGVAGPAIARAGDQQPRSYIVVLHDGADGDAVAADHARRENAQVRYVYRSALDGYTATMSPAAAARITRDPRVAYVELDGEVHITAQTKPTGVDRIEADNNSLADIDGNDARVLVDVAVIDTGIDLEHPDLNVFKSTDCRYSSGGSPWTRTYSCGSGGNDGHGHGTHVTGTVGALDNGIGVVGVAPGARMWAVKVLDDNGSGSWGAVIAGIDYVDKNASEIEVANMSLGGSGYSKAMHDALASAVGKGVVFMVAAGNDGQDVFGNDGAFGTSDDHVPAAYPEVAAISALNDTDGEPGGLGPSSSYNKADDSFIYWSNFSRTNHSSNPVSSVGKAVDLLMPGVDILSTVPGGYASYSGTSMASPHAAGLAALHIAANTRAADAAGVAAIRQALIDGGQDQASGNRLLGSRLSTEPDTFHEPLGWASDGGSAIVGTAPTADDGTKTVAEDSGATAITLTGSDAATCDLTFAISGGPAHGSLSAVITDQTCAGTGPYTDSASVSYTPAPDYSGPDSFTFTVTDGATNTDSGTVSITVSPMNDAPAALDDSASTAIGGSVVVSVLANDSDLDGSDTLTVAEVTTPTTGTATHDGTSVTYTHTGLSAGSDSFTYTISDGNGGTDTATVSITISAAASTMHVADLESASVNLGSEWRPAARIKVVDANGQAVEGAAVTGTWGHTGASTNCVTDAAGWCTTQSASTLRKNTGSTTFTVTGVTGSLTYDASSNTDADGDSDGTTVTVVKP